MRPLDRLPYRTLQWLVAAFAALHNLEEGLTMPAYALEVRRRLSGVAPPLVLAATRDLTWFYVGLIVATLARSWATATSCDTSARSPTESDRAR